MSMFDGICGKVAPGLCRLSMDGSIAVRTRSGYRSYDAEHNRLTNCDSFVLDVGEDFFFVVPTNKVRAGDIILAGGLPKCVTKADGDEITAVSFEDATVETLVPERHLFMGNTYLYGRIVSMFGSAGAKGKKGAGRMMKYMMLSQMLKGKEGGSALLPLMLLGGRENPIEDLFNPDDGDDEKEA